MPYGRPDINGPAGSIPPNAECRLDLETLEHGGNPWPHKPVRRWTRLLRSVMLFVRRLRRRTRPTPYQGYAAGLTPAEQRLYPLGSRPGIDSRLAAHDGTSLS